MPVRTAKTALSLYWDRSIPIDPAQIARQAGARVEPDPSMPQEGLSGRFEAIGPVKAIYFNPFDAAVRQRFTIAHELGHMLLEHGPSFRDNAKNYSTSALFKEREANSFAAELLMPAEVVEWLIHSKGMTNIQEMASALNVSGAAMEYRLMNLGMLHLV